MTKNRMKTWSPEDVDELIVAYHAGERTSTLAKRLGRSHNSLSSIALDLRDAGESFVTQGMRRLPAEAEKDYKARVLLAADEVRMRKEKIRNRRASHTEAPVLQPPEGRREEMKPQTNGQPKMRVVFYVGETLVQDHEMDALKWARLLDHVAGWSTSKS